MIGWRKLSAWAAVFVLVAGATYLKQDVPPHAKDLLMFVTSGFFMTNAAGKFARAKGGSEPS